MARVVAAIARIRERKTSRVTGEWLNSLGFISTRKECRRASRSQQRARLSVSFVGADLRDRAAVNDAVMLAQRQIAFRGAAIEQQHHGRPDCGCDMHGPSVVRHKDRQTRLRRSQLRYRELIKDERR